MESSNTNNLSTRNMAQQLETQDRIYNIQKRWEGAGLSPTTSRADQRLPYIPIARDGRRGAPSGRPGGGRPLPHTVCYDLRT